MKSAFTISFNFEGKTYLALASVKKEKEQDLSYTVHIYNDELSRIIPNRTIRYSKREVETPLQHPLAPRLCHCIKESVHAHLKISSWPKSEKD